MPTIVNNPSPPLESMVSHSWLAEDQKTAFAASRFVPNTQSVSQHLSPWLLRKGVDSAAIRQGGVFINDKYITACLMNQALDYLQRALCNTAAQYLLAAKGFETWARVTNYYAGYFCVHCLLCLQGRTITTLQLDKPLTIQIIPLDLRNHFFAVTTRYIGRNPHHMAPWNRYYDIYDRYAVPQSAYELVVRKAYITEPCDEAIERNALNYAPFTGFKEIRDLSRQLEFRGLFSNYVSNLETKISFEEFLTDLQGYASDPEYRYFARTLLRLALAGDIIRSIRSESNEIDSEWRNLSQNWQNLLGNVFPQPNNCYLLRFVPLIGSEPN